MIIKKKIKTKKKISISGGGPPKVYKAKGKSGLRKGPSKLLIKSQTQSIDASKKKGPDATTQDKLKAIGVDTEKLSKTKGILGRIRRVTKKITSAPGRAYAYTTGGIKAIVNKPLNAINKRLITRKLTKKANKFASLETGTENPYKLAMDISKQEHAVLKAAAVHKKLMKTKGASPEEVAAAKAAVDTATDTLKSTRNQKASIDTMLSSAKSLSPDPIKQTAEIEKKKADYTAQIEKLKATQSAATTPEEKRKIDFEINKLVAQKTEFEHFTKHNMDKIPMISRALADSTKYEAKLTTARLTVKNAFSRNRIDTLSAIKDKGLLKVMLSDTGKLLIAPEAILRIGKKISEGTVMQRISSEWRHFGTKASRFFNRKPFRNQSRAELNKRLQEDIAAMKNVQGNLSDVQQNIKDAADELKILENKTDSFSLRRKAKLKNRIDSQRSLYISLKSEESEIKGLVAKTQDYIKKKVVRKTERQTKKLVKFQTRGADFTAKVTSTDPVLQEKIKGVSNYISTIGQDANGNPTPISNIDINKNKQSLADLYASDSMSKEEKKVILEQFYALDKLQKKTLKLTNTETIGKKAEGLQEQLKERATIRSGVIIKSSGSVIINSSAISNSVDKRAKTYENEDRIKKEAVDKLKLIPPITLEGEDKPVNIADIIKGDPTLKKLSEGDNALKIAEITEKLVKDKKASDDEYQRLLKLYEKGGKVGDPPVKPIIYNTPQDFVHAIKLEFIKPAIIPGSTPAPDPNAPVPKPPGPDDPVPVPKPPGPDDPNAPPKPTPAPGPDDPNAPPKPTPAPGPDDPNAPPKPTPAPGPDDPNAPPKPPPPPGSGPSLPPGSGPPPKPVPAGPIAPPKNFHAQIKKQLEVSIQNLDKQIQFNTANIEANEKIINDPKSTPEAINQAKKNIEKDRQNLSENQETLTSLKNAKADHEKKFAVEIAKADEIDKAYEIAKATEIAKTAEIAEAAKQEQTIAEVTKKKEEIMTNIDTNPDFKAYLATLDTEHAAKVAKLREASKKLDELNKKTQNSNKPLDTDQLKSKAEYEKIIFDASQPKPSEDPEAHKDTFVDKILDDFVIKAPPIPGKIPVPTPIPPKPTGQAPILGSQNNPNKNPPLPQIEASEKFQAEQQKYNEDKKKHEEYLQSVNEQIKKNEDIYNNPILAPEVKLEAIENNKKLLTEQNEKIKEFYSVTQKFDIIAKERELFRADEAALLAEAKAAKEASSNTYYSNITFEPEKNIYAELDEFAPPPSTPRPRTSGPSRPNRPNEYLLTDPEDIIKDYAKSSGYVEVDAEPNTTSRPRQNTMYARPVTSSNTYSTAISTSKPASTLGENIYGIPPKQNSSPVENPYGRLGNKNRSSMIPASTAPLYQDMSNANVPNIAPAPKTKNNNNNSDQYPYTTEKNTLITKQNSTPSKTKFSIKKRLKYALVNPFKSLGGTVAGAVLTGVGAVGTGLGAVGTGLAGVYDAGRAATLAAVTGVKHLHARRQGLNKDISYRTKLKESVGPVFKRTKKAAAATAVAGAFTLGSVAATGLGAVGIVANPLAAVVAPSSYLK